MPRIAPTQREKIRITVRDTIAAQYHRSIDAGCTCQDAAAALGFKISTYYNKTDVPGTITLDELITVASAMNISLPTLLGWKLNEKGEIIS